jgi:hypothetical protein
MTTKPNPSHGSPGHHVRMARAWLNSVPTSCAILAALQFLYTVGLSKSGWTKATGRRYPGCTGGARSSIGELTCCTYVSSPGTN